MRPLLFDACSACCEGITLLTFESIPAVPSRQCLSVLLTNGMACTRNTDEDLKGMQCCTETLQTWLGGQQVLRSGQQVERMPKSQQPYLPRGLNGQHRLLAGQYPPSGHRTCNKD